MAAPTGKDGSAELVCQAALPNRDYGSRGSDMTSI